MNLKWLYCIITISYSALANLGPFTQELLRRNDMKINREECQKIEEKLGQLFYVNVDSFQTVGHSINPEYIKMVKDLNIGGVLPKFGFNIDLNMIKKATRNLQNATTLPLLISVDRDNVSIGSEIRGNYGLGWGVGELGSIDNYSPQCANRLAELQAFLHRVVGLNHALGPTVEKKGTKFLSRPADEVFDLAKLYFDRFDEMGVATTMKHFPYTPETYNLHEKTEDTKIPKEKVLEMLEIFKRSAVRAPFAMTTHLLNSNIDAENMATFSKKWIDMLRNDVGFKGLLMTDGLFMIENYKTINSQLIARWPRQGRRNITNKHAIFAAKAILSGHDMVFLEGNAGQTRNVFRDVHYFACQNSEVAKNLRDRIFESHERIKTFKESNNGVLRTNVEIPESLAQEGIKLIADHNQTADANNQCEMSRLINKMQTMQSGVGMGLGEGLPGVKNRALPTRTEKFPEMKCEKPMPKICSDNERYEKFASQVKVLNLPSYAVTTQNSEAQTPLETK